MKIPCLLSDSASMIGAPFVPAYKVKSIWPCAIANACTVAQNTIFLFPFLARFFSYTYIIICSFDKSGKSCFAS